MRIAIEWLPVVDLAGAWLSTYLVHSSVLLLAALGLSRWLGTRQLPLQEALLRVAVVGGLLTATLQTGLGWEPAGGSIPYPTVAVSTEASLPAAAGAAERVLETAAVPATGLAATPAGSTPAEPPVTDDGLGVSWLAALVVLWGAGAALLVGRLFLLAAALRRRLVDRTEVRGGSLFRLFWRLLASADIDRPTRLTRSARLQVPIALGLGGREICLPQRVVRELPADQQETVLAHELAHLERHDPLWLLAVRLVESVLFVQPLNRVARRRLQELAEYGCDDWAARHTGRPDTLARCLTEVASWSVEEPALALAPTMAQRSGLGRRVRRLLATDYSFLEMRPPAWWRPLAGAMLLLVVLAVPGFTVLGQEAAPEAAEAPRVEPDAEAAPTPSAPSEPQAVEAPPKAEVPAAPPAVPAGAAADLETIVRAAVPTAVPSPAPVAPEVSPEVAPAPVLPQEPTAVAPLPPGEPGALDEVAPSPEAPEPVQAPSAEPVPSSAPVPAAEPEPSVEPADDREVIRIRVAPKARVVHRIDERQVVRPASRVRSVSAPRAVARVAVRSVAGAGVGTERDHEHDVELEEDLDILDDELEAMLEEVGETLEHDLEAALEGLDEEMERLEEQLEAGLEGELDLFEEELEVEMEDLEREMERLEQELERRFDSEEFERHGERLEIEMERLEEGMEALGEQLDRDLERVERQLQERLKSRFEPLIDEQLGSRVEEMSRRLEAESRQLEEMAAEIAERHLESGVARLDVEERERLTDEARRLAELARPSVEEMEALRQAVREMRPSAAEAEEMRRELAEELVVIRERLREGLEAQRRALEALGDEPPE